MTVSVKRWIVLFRDNFTCQMCGRKGRFYRLPWGDEDDNGMYCDLNAHHINGERIDDFTNMITLCSDCHFKVHQGDWKKKPQIYFKPKPVTEKLIQKAREDYSRRNQNRYAIETIEAEEEIIS